MKVKHEGGQKKKRAALGWVLAILIGTSLAGMNCSKKSDATASASGSGSAAVDTEAVSQQAAEAGIEDTEDAKRELLAACTAFRASKEGPAQDRRAAYRAVLAAYEKAKPAADVAAYPGIPSPTAGQLLARLDALTLEAEEESKAAPNIPEEPKHDPPKYDGAFKIAGVVRHCFQDGVALEVRGKFYFVRDANCPDVSILHGFVEDTGSTVQLDIGRDGREAAVVTISDAEKARDDRAAHREALASYEAEYVTQVQAYRAALRDNSEAVKALAKNRAARAQERKTSEKALDVVLLALAQGQAQPDATGAGVPTVGGAPPPMVRPVGGSSRATGQATPPRKPSRTAALREPAELPPGVLPPLPPAALPPLSAPAPAPSATPTGRAGCGCKPGDLTCGMRCKKK